MSPKSVMMDQLYGEELANFVYNRLQNLDPELNREIQRIAYDHYWARPGLSIRDKSYVTVVSLIALSKEEQIRIHLNGFLNAGGTVEVLSETLLQLSILTSTSAALNGLHALREVLSQRKLDDNTIRNFVFKTEERLREITLIKEINLSSRDLNISTISALVALGDLIKLKVAMKAFLENSESTKEDLKNILIHQIVYCGFPSAMNGFAVLNDLSSKTH